MRKLIISAALAAATLASVPAAANHNYHRSSWNQRHYGDYRYQRVSRQAVYQLVRELDRAEYRIQRSAQRGQISPREYRALRNEAGYVRNLLHRASRNGISVREFNLLQVRVNRLERHIRNERRDWDGRRG